MKNTLCILFMIVSNLFLAGCKSPTDQSEGMVVLDKNLVADKFGDNDGVTTEAEIDSLHIYFSLHEYAWCTGTFAVDNKESDFVTLEQVIQSFSLKTLPYATEQEFRNAVEGISIRTPWVSVIVIEQKNGTIQVIKYFRSPGPNISSAEWKRLDIR